MWDGSGEDFRFGFPPFSLIVRLSITWPPERSHPVYLQVEAPFLVFSAISPSWARSCLHSGNMSVGSRDNLKNLVAARCIVLRVEHDCSLSRTGVEIFVATIWIDRDSFALSQICHHVHVAADP